MGVGGGWGHWGWVGHHVYRLLGHLELVLQGGGGRGGRLEGVRWGVNHVVSDFGVSYSGGGVKGVRGRE